MNFSFSVCEFDPLHNGHAHLISEMKKSGSAVGIMMSGNFTQRGEIAVLDKYTRAIQAIKAGADVVFELPTVFSVAPAEIFAKGAIKLLSSIEGANTLYFGTELGTQEEIIKLANCMNNETKEFKEELKRLLAEGHPFAYARTEALKNLYSDLNLALLDNPNSILAVEYSRAIQELGTQMQIEPIMRIGTGYKDKNSRNDICSSSAIRLAIQSGKIKKLKNCMPPFVYNELPKELPTYGDIALYSLLKSSSQDLKNLTDCSEGLENRIKAISRSATDYETFINKLETRRYTRARLTRIVATNMLGITRNLVEKCLKGTLYLKVLAIAEDKTELLSTLSTSKNKLLTRKSDADALGGIADDCFNVDVFASDLYALSSKKGINEYEMKVVKR